MSNRLVYWDGTEFKERAPSAEEYDNHSSQHEDGGSDEIDLTGLQGESAELVSHKAENVTSGTQPHGLRLNKYDATVPPTVDNDETQGYSVGSKWVNITEDEEVAYICLKADTGEAKWEEISTPPTPWGDGIPYYWEGEEFVETTGGWVLGDSNSTGVRSKEGDHLFISATGATSYHFYSTDDPIDVTNISTIKLQRIGINQSGDGTHQRLAGMYVGGAKNDATFDARNMSDAPGELTQAVDVSGLTGLKYIKVTVFHQSQASGTSSCEFYRLWGE